MERDGTFQQRSSSMLVVVVDAGGANDDSETSSSLSSSLLSKSTSQQQQQQQRKEFVPETFDIDVEDTPPDHRWDDVVTKYRNQTLEVMDFVFDNLIPPDKFRQVVDALDLVEEYWWPKSLEFRQEIKGIANILDIEPGLVLLLNVVYELVSACTSVVAQHSPSGTIWHGRNLDFDIPNLQSITINVRFVNRTKSGGRIRRLRSGGENNNIDGHALAVERQHDDENQVLYEGTTYVGLVGLFTGMRPNSFSLSEDQRWTDHGNIWDNVVEWIFKGGRSVSFLYREVLQTAPDFDTALIMLQETPLIAPGYIIIGGTKSGEGAVVSRERNGPADTWMIDYDDSDNGNDNVDDDGKSKNKNTNQWFLVQTNDDHWRPPKDNRRQATNDNMKLLIGRPENVSNDTLFKVLNQPPTLNELTTYTTIMSAGRNYFHSVTQYYGTNGIEYTTF